MPMARGQTLVQQMRVRQCRTKKASRTPSQCHPNVRQPFKKVSFLSSGRVRIFVPTGTLFSFFRFFRFFFPKILVIFLPKGGKKKGGGERDFAAARMAIIWATRYTGDKLFFKDGLNMVLVILISCCLSTVSLRWVANANIPSRDITVYLRHRKMPFGRVKTRCVA